MSREFGSATNPVAPPPLGTPLRPLGFDLSWHGEAVGGCFPGPLHAQVFVPIEKCHEVYYGTVTQIWVNPQTPEDYLEHEYQYYVDLLDPDVWGDAWHEVAGEHYWLNVQAVFPALFVPSGQYGEHAGWGWMNSDEQYQCDSVVSNIFSPGWTWDNHPFYGTPTDLAFELTTTEPGDSPYYGPIVITNVERWLPGEYRVQSVGTCGAGKQYLQLCTNLVSPDWSNVAVRVAPFIPPDTNVWIHVPGASNGFYRILEK
jgi:hypothetical protein